MKSCLILFISLFCLCSCISEKSLKKLSATGSSGPPAPIENLNGKYQAYDSATYSNLWQALYFCKSFNYDLFRIPKTSVVQLELNGTEMTATLSDNGVTLNQVKLKVKVKNNSVTVKRNLFLVPIPFIFYRYHEARALLYISASGCLDLSYRRNQFVWILMAGSVSEKTNHCFQKINN